eukprot:TRINITY_DN1926_c1_g1_i1.p1 TRINITY_DN1926_c1_g1~~TRINITY_DN1926_c1_g1_i1.p1  ORF type:complete len:586 (+),score=178.55 TRINITY_DN1926_c1_g1_i1:96-1853(+)
MAEKSRQPSTSVSAATPPVPDALQPAGRHRQPSTLEQPLLHDDGDLLFPAAFDGASGGSLSMASSHSSLWQIDGAAAGGTRRLSSMGVDVARTASRQRPVFGADGMHEHRLKKWGIAVAAAMAFFAMGYDAAPVVEAAVEAVEVGGLSSTQRAGLVAAAPLAAALAALLTPWVTVLTGRRHTAIIGAVLHTLGAAGRIWGGGAGEHTLARAVAGLGVGLLAAAVPVYVAEGKLAGRRGAAVCAAAAWFAVGEAWARGAEWLVIEYGGGGVRWGPAVAAAAGAALLGALLLVDESHRWLAFTGRPSEARKAFIHLHSFNALSAQEEFFSVQRAADSVLLAQPYPPRSHGDAGREYVATSLPALCRTTEARRAIAAACVLMALTQATGRDAVVASATNTASPVAECRGALACAAAAAAGTALAACLIDGAPRRRRALLLASGGGAVVTLAAAGAAAAVDIGGAGAVVRWCLAGAHLFTHGVGFGGVPWVVAAETTAFSARTAACAAAAAVFWAMRAAAVLASPALVAASAPAALFGAAAVAAAGCGFVGRYLPDAGGVTLEQVGQVFRMPLVAAARHDASTLLSLPE